ncbi:MAG: hypothetical protein WC763_06935 [Candidatus Paceibacterota bacterium]|jgi:hypothetical protein
MARRFKLNDGHPTALALGRVFDKMRDEGISIVLNEYGSISVRHEGRDTVFILLEVDQDTDPVEFPPPLETKLVYEKSEKVR